MSLENFRKLIDETGDYLLFLHFWGWGEPFLNKDFFSMIRYAKNKGIKIITSTNGHFFEEEENIDRLIDSGLDVLVFAVDGIDKETYETYRKHGDFEKVLRGLQLLVQRKNERGVSLPLINLRIRKKNRCKKMWNHPTVYLDGTVVPCDYYTGHEFSLGNAFSAGGSGFRRVWFGRDYRQFRYRFLKGRCSGLRCGNCSMNFADVDRCVSHAFDLSITAS